MSDEWGPWVDGTNAPPVGEYVQMDCRELKGRGDTMHEGIILRIDKDDVYVSPPLPLARVWEVDRWRIRKPRALIDMIERAAELDRVKETT